MAVRIRLTRMGRKKRPFYRIVVADSRAPRDGKYIECIGTYNSITHPIELSIEEERVNYWLDQGAIPSDTVKNLLQRQGVIYRRHLAKRGLDAAMIDEEMKKWEVLQIEKRRREDAKAEARKKAKAEKAATKSEDTEEKGGVQEEGVTKEKKEAKVKEQPEKAVEGKQEVPSQEKDEGEKKEKTGKEAKAQKKASKSTEQEKKTTADKQGEDDDEGKADANKATEKDKKVNGA